MTTAGQILASKSGLGSATAAQHLIAILNGRLTLPQKAGDILVASSYLTEGTAAELLLNLNVVTYVYPSGLEAYALTNKVLVWGMVVPGQLPDYSQITPDPFSSYELIHPTQDPNYSDVTFETTPSFMQVMVLSDPSYVQAQSQQAPNWVTTATVAATIEP